MHEIDDMRGAAVGKIALDRMHVPERTGQQICVVGRPYQTMQILLKRWQMLPDFVKHLWQHFEIDVVLFHKDPGQPGKVVFLSGL